MLVLGIESSCDETGAAVVRDDGFVLSDVVQSQVELHAQYGGVVPELASRDHLKNAPIVVRSALGRAGVSLEQIDAIAVTHRPGLVGALLVGVQIAKGLAWGADKPLVGVDHLMGHLLAVFLRRGAEGDPASSPTFPFVSLLVSGGHTALYRVDAPRPDAIVELGATRDDAAGECFDKVAKLLGLGYPGGPRIDQLAKDGDPKAIAFTPPMARRGSLEFSFSGMKTQVAQYVARNGIPQSKEELSNVCAAFQSRVVHVLARKLFEAAEQERVNNVVLGGGVAANRGLRQCVHELGEKTGRNVFVPPLASCTDNAAMIAYVGARLRSEGITHDWELTATSKTLLPRTTRKGRGRRDDA